MLGSLAGIRRSSEASTVKKDILGSVREARSVNTKIAYTGLCCGNSSREGWIFELNELQEEVRRLSSTPWYPGYMSYE